MKYISDAIKTFFKAFADQLRLVIHDEGVIIFFIFLPLVYPILYSLIYNPEIVRDVDTVIVDNDMSALSRETTRNLNATQGINIIGNAVNLDEARKAVNEHKAYAIIEIPRNYERKITNGTGSQLIFYAEMSLMLRYKSVLMAMTDVSQAMGAELMQKDINTIAPLAETIATGDPMGIHAISMGNIEEGFDSFIMPGVLILIIHQCIILAVGMAGGARFEYPSKLGFNPLAKHPHELPKMSGEMLCFFCIILPFAIWVMYYIPLLFKFPMAGDIWQELMFITPMIIAAISLGLCLQTIIWQRENIFIIWVITSVIFLFLSGLTWPRYAMSPLWKTISDLVPATWGVEGFIRMNTNGATLSQTATPYHNLWYLAGAYTLLAYILQRWIVRPAIRRRFILDASTPQDLPTAGQS